MIDIFLYILYINGYILEYLLNYLLGKYYLFVFMFNYSLLLSFNMDVVHIPSFFYELKINRLFLPYFLLHTHSYHVLMYDSNKGIHIIYLRFVMLFIKNSLRTEESIFCKFYIPRDT